MNRSVLLPLFLVCLNISTPCSARIRCDRALEPAQLIISDPFWAENNAVLLHTPDGKSVPITYSFDTEIPDAEIFERIYKDPELFAKLKDASSKPIPVEDLLRNLGMSRKQLFSFAAKKGANQEANELLLTDLHSRYVFGALNDDLDKHMPIRNAAVQKWLGDLNIVVDKDNAIYGEVVEIRHNTFDTSPVTYRNLIEKLHTRVARPQTHFHIGIPSAATTETSFLAIARAIETRVIFRMAIEDPDPTISLRHRGSVLDGDHSALTLQWGARGVIKAQFNAFNGNVPAHDIEIRQWFSTEEAMSEVKFVSELAQNAPSLRVVPGYDGNYSEDFYTQNLRGALHYAGNILSFSQEKKTSQIGRDLLNLSNKMTSENGPTPTERKLAAKLLVENNVLDLLTVEAFMVRP